MDICLVYRGLVHDCQWSGVMVLGLFFAKLYRSLDTVTVPGVLGSFVGQQARTVASILLIFVMIAVGTAQIIAAGTLGVTVLD